MLTKMLWLVIILSNMIHASTERSAHEKKEYIRCFDGQISFIEKKNNLFYSSLQHAFSNQKDASIDSCKKQYLVTKKHTLVCSNKQDILKTIKNIKKHKQIRYPSCFTLQEKLNLLVSAHAYYHNHLSYFHIQYQGHDLFIPKYALNVTTQQISKHTKKRYNVSKHRYHKKKKYVHKKKRYRKIKKKHRNLKKKRTRVKHKKMKYHTSKHTTQKAKTIQKSVNHNHKAYTYKCLGSHGNVNIYATDDNSISMASDILWRMCQKLKTEDEECKIRDCYKLIK